MEQVRHREVVKMLVESHFNKEDAMKLAHSVIKLAEAANPEYIKEEEEYE